MVDDLDEHAVHDPRDLAARLAHLEIRLAQLEKHLGLVPPTAGARDVSVQPDAAPAAATGGAGQSSAARPALEVRLGESGLAWIAGAVLPVGIAFLMATLFGRGHALMACLTGFAAAAAMFALSRVWKRSYGSISRVMEVASVLLVFYSTARLHFFSTQPVVASRATGSVLLLLATAGMLAWAIRRRSAGRTGLCLLLAALASLLIGSFHASMMLLVLLAALAVALHLRRGWSALSVWAIACFQLAFAVVVMGNPVATGRLQAVSDRPAALGYALALLVAFAWPSLSKARVSSSTYGPPALLCLNAAGSFLLVAVVAASSLSHAAAWAFLPAALVFLALAVTQWSRTRARFAPALFASTGFMAMSVAIFAWARMPHAFPWLALQSLLVVSVALWFRSRLLVVANSVIFIVVLATYLVARQPMHLANFGFAVVSLVSARIMNWKRERLELQTEMMRNVYLVIAFLLVPYALYHAVPRQYVSLSWVAAAAVYFAVGLLLRNVKYRWMAVGTLLLTLPLLVFRDVARLSPGYRVAAFLALGLIAVLISLFYGRIHNLVRGGPTPRGPDEGGASDEQMRT